ncbi:MAG: molecular chaperone DjiA [Rhizobiales bacterium]|nr:molecular chaperone DjiA [Hyphomicrobiales bacterium]
MTIWEKISALLAEGVETLSNWLRTGEPEQQVAFTIGVIALGAKMAKADGVVSQAEITAFKQVFTVRDEELPNVARVFNLAKQDVAGYDAYARRLARLFKAKPEVLETVLDGLFHISKADDVVHPAELEYLHSVAEIFGISDECFSRIKARHLIEDMNPYMVLGIGPEASNIEIKEWYRKLVREIHPDKLVANGMPEEAVDLAGKSLATINAAYDEISRERRL